MTASIRFDGGAGPVVLTPAVPVTLSNFDNTGVLGWEWLLLDKPAGSGTAIASPNTPMASFTPDIEGTYLVQLRTFEDAGRTILDAIDRDAGYIRYAIPFAWRIPAASETTEVDSTRGWATEVNEILIAVRAALISGGGGASPGIKFHLRLGDAIVVPADYQYIVKAPGPILDAGSSLTISAGAQLVVIP